MERDPREGQKCKNCGLDATLGPTISPDGVRHQHYHPFMDGCLAALIAEVKLLRSELDYLKDFVDG